MTRAVPWNVKGVDFDAREAAKAAARRAGMSLGEWLNSIIADQAAELGVTTEDFDDDERLEAVTARLATLSKRPEQGLSRGMRRSDRDGRETARRAPQPDYEAEFTDLRRPRAIYDDDDRRARPLVDPEQLLDRAISAFDRRTGLANDRTSTALAKVSQRLADIEGRLEFGAQVQSQSPAKEALSKLEARLDGIARQGIVVQDVGGKLGELDRKLTAIAGRLELAETKPPLGGRSEDLARIEAKLNRLSETIARAARPQPHPTAANRAPLARRSVADAIAEITQRQAALDDGARPAPPSDHLGNLQADLAGLSTRFDEMRRDIVARDEQQFRAIGEKIEALGAARPDAASLARIRSQTEEIRNLLATAVAQPRPIENIEGQIAALVQRVETIAASGPSPSAFALVDSNLAEIRAALERPATDPLLQQIESRIEGLTRKVEEALSNPAGSEHFDELTQRLDLMHQSLAARMEQPAAALDTSAFEAMMRDIAGKLDQPPSAAIDAPHLEDLLSRLTDRLDAPTSTSRLEEMVRDLANRIDGAAVPRTDQQALSALQNQIERLAHRLDDVDVNAGAFGSLERSIADLFVGLEETRRAAVDAAETAARTAARDTLREAVLAPPPGLRQSADEQTEHVTREFADLRALQDAADRQTHATLTAVHETLEKVVDRLAMLEDDIVEVRNATSEQPSAAGPPPLFAPSLRLGGAAEMPRAGFPDLTATSSRRSETSRALDDLPAPRFDDRDFLIEPGTGFSPERRSGETDRRSDEKPRPPSPPDSKPPAAPPFQPSASSLPPPAGSTQANFIAAARRTIQANTADTAASTPRKGATALDGALADARSRARAAAALLDDVGKPEDKAGKERRSGGPLARASAFLLARKRPLVLGLAGIVVVLCALEFVHTQASPPAVVVDTAGVPVPGTASARVPAPAKTAPIKADPAASVPAFVPQPAGSALPAELSPERTSSLAAPNVDLAPLASIAPLAPAPAAPADLGPADLAVVRDLAAGGNLAAEFELGIRYAEGRGLPHDPALAAQWLTKAARKDNAPAQYRLGTLYEKGIGVARDSAVALNWYQRAASAGNVRAMHNLAVLIAEGIDGKPKYDDAAIWFRKAAEFGVRDSEYNLAILYARGLGVEKDLSQSFIWFALAAAQGDEDAAGKRDEVAAHLDARQLAAAKASIDGFTPRRATDSANNVAPPPGGWGSLKAVLGPNAKHGPDAKPAGSAKVSTL